MVSCHFQNDFVGMGARNKFAANRNQLYMSCNSTKLIFINPFIDLGVDNRAPKRAKGGGGGSSHCVTQALIIDFCYSLTLDLFTLLCHCCY